MIKEFYHKENLEDWSIKHPEYILRLVIYKNGVIYGHFDEED